MSGIQKYSGENGAGLQRTETIVADEICQRRYYYHGLVSCPLNSRVAENSVCGLLKRPKMHGGRKIIKRRVGTGAYPYNRTRGAYENNHVVGATPCGCPTIKRNGADESFQQPARLDPFTHPSLRSLNRRAVPFESAF